MIPALLDEAIPTRSERSGVARRLRGTIEAVVLALVALSPWAFAAVHPLALMVLYAGLAVALLLWVAVLLVERRLPVGPCPVALSLAGLVLLGVWQLVPLPAATLAAVSPATVELRARLTPAEHESVAGDDPVATADRGTISLYPAVTRGQVLKLLAVLALFAVVRYAVASPDSFRRFAWVAVVNGALLSLFALVQLFTSPPHILYWHFESQGSVFGPFVCRNHFPFYTNVCLGLAVGLLLGMAGFGRSTTWQDTLARLGRHPAALWLGLALALMVAADLYSLSRGGVVALVGAALVCGLTAVARRPAGLAVVAAAAAVGLGLVVWLGGGEVGQRLATLWGNDLLTEGRAAVWARALPLAGRFPVWGTGYGTFEFVEPLERRPGDPAEVTWDHAHNEYLEMLVEGGAVGLLLVVLAIALVYRGGLRAGRRHAGRPAAAWAFGALFGLTTAIIHSFGDFGLHIPSIVVLLTVLAAQLTALGERDAGTVRPTIGGRAVALAAATACVAVAVLLPLDGWHRERIERLRLAALRAGNRLEPDARDRVIQYLDSAVRLSPDDAVLRLSLAEARNREYLARKSGDPGEAFLLPALRDYLRSRDDNPLLAIPHARLAGYRAQLRHADAAASYLDRACQLNPADAGAWYLVGLNAVEEGDAERGWACWRRSLECAPAHLAAIVPQAWPRLGAAGMLDRVLPANPDLLVAAARALPAGERAADRRVILTRALELLGDPDAIRPEQMYLRAWLLRETGRAGEAVAAYQRAVERWPDRADWRCEFAELLHEQGELALSLQQVRRVLQQAPDHPRARELHAALVREQALRR